MNRTILAVMSALVLQVGCGGLKQNGDDDEVNGLLDSSDSSSSESALMAAAADTETTAMPATAEELATRASARWATRWRQGCASVVSVTGATVVYQLTDCTGPYGLI